MQSLQTRQIFAALIAIIVVGANTSADENIPREKLPTSWAADAELTDVFFFNANLGWAVGAQGVILRTTNGGNDWLEISQLNESSAQQMTLDEKFRALRNGTKTQWTGVANEASNSSKTLRCRFESVHFVDEKHGWVAGGYNVPYVDRSRAVILKTSDGGISWRSVTGLFMPRIKRIRFVDRANGWAVGDRGNLFRTGISFTSDGGETWSSQSSDDMLDWIDGEKTSTGFVNISTLGQPAVVNNNRLEQSVLLSGAQPKLRMVRLLDDQQGWAVGAQGTVLQTSNGGLSWTPLSSRSESTATTSLQQILQQFDFNTISFSPTKIWFAGNPGSLIFSIDRQTGSISTHTTGLALPIKDLHFVDDQHGWAVGSLGSILSTADGGTSWQVQNGHHRSVALMGVAQKASALPLGIFANIGGEENRICAAVVLDPSVSDEAIQACDRLGCVTTLPIVADSASESTSDQKLAAMVRAIRTFRPNVILCNSSIQSVYMSGQGRDQDAGSFNPESFLRTAIRAAADRNAFGDQLRLANLEVWSVDRLAIRDPVGTLVISPQQMLPRMGMLLEDQIAVSRALLNLPLSETEKSAYRVEHFSIANRSNESDLFAGLAQLGRPLPTRAADQGFRGSLHALQLANSKQKKLAEFAQFSIHSDQDLRVWNQQVLSWAITLDENMAGVWLAQLAERYLIAGKTELAANTFEMLATRMYQHALAPAAAAWLIQYNASDEFGQVAFREWVQTKQQQSTAIANLRIGNARVGSSATQMTQSNAGGVSQLVWTPVAEKIQTAGSQLTDESKIKLASLDLEMDLNLDGNDSQDDQSIPLEKLVVDDAEIQQFFQSRYQQGSKLLLHLGQRDPDLVASRQYRVLESQLNAKQGGAMSAENLWKQLIHDDLRSDEVSVIAQRELQLLRSSTSVDSNSTESGFRCRRMPIRPQLDGSLDEAVWQSLMEERRGGSNPARVQSAAVKGTQFTAQDSTFFAYDDQFLYVAIRCQKIPGQYYQDDQKRRPRDADLSRRDRVEFSFDIDRDYRSSNDFVVDYRGWCADACGEAVGWNPDWFISHREDETSWTVELAIPLDQLVAGPFDSKSVWAVRLARRTSDDTNLWQPDSRSSKMLTGWQSQLIARPNDFELLTFE